MSQEPVPYLISALRHGWVLPFWNLQSEIALFCIIFAVTVYRPKARGFGHKASCLKKEKQSSGVSGVQRMEELEFPVYIRMAI